MKFITHSFFSSSFLAAFFLSSFFQRSLAIRAASSASAMVLSLLKRAARGRSPESTTVLRGSTATVHLNWATNSPTFSVRTGYPVRRS